MKLRLKNIKLTRKQQIIRNCLLLTIAALILIWSFGDKNEREFKSTDEALEYTLTEILGLEKPYEIIRDYNFLPGECTFKREVYVKSNIGDEDVIIKASVSARHDSKTVIAYEPEVVSVESFFNIDKNITPWANQSINNNFLYFLGNFGLIELGSWTNSKITCEDDYVTVEIDCLKDYGNSMEGGHLKNFTPDLIYTYHMGSGRVEWKSVAERCRELGMILTDQQAEKIAVKLIDLRREYLEKGVSLYG